MRHRRESRLGRRLRSLTGAAVAVTLLVAGQPAQAAPAGGQAAATPAVVSNSFTRGLTSAIMQSSVVEVPSSAVVGNLIAVSPDGSTLTFKKALGPLASLSAGKVVVLEGYETAVVSAVSHAGGRLVLTTTPATLTDVYKTANLSMNEPVNFSNAFAVLDPGTAPDPSSDSGAMRSDAREQPNGLGLPAPTATLAYVGVLKGGGGYKISLTPGPTELGWEIVLCWGASIVGDNCTNRGGGIQVSLTVSGTISRAAIQASADILNGHNTKSTMTWTWGGKILVNYKILRGTSGSKTYKLPAFTFPVTFNIPIIVFGVPMMVKMQLAELITIALSSNNSTVQGGITLNYNGSQGASESGGTDSPLGAKPKVSGTFLDTVRSITLSSAGTEFATQLKLGFGPGIPAANFLGFVAVVAALGQVTPSLVAGLSCSQYYFNFSGSAYLEMQLATLRLKVPISNFTIPEKQTHAQC